MHATFVTLWLQVVQPLVNVHGTKWTPHVKRETDGAQSYTSSAYISVAAHLRYLTETVMLENNAVNNAVNKLIRFETIITT